MVLQVAREEGAIAIAHVLRLRHVGRTDEDALVRLVEAGRGSVEHAVGAGNLEAHDVLPRRQTVVGIAEEHLNLAAVHLHVVEFRRIAGNGLEAIGAVQRHVGQSIAHLALLCGMNLAALMRIDQVVGADAAGILNQSGSLVLAVAEAWSAPVVVASPRGNLHFEERHLLGGAAKLRTPEVDHCLEALRIGVVLAHVRLALIPQEAAHRVVAQGMQHAVVHDTGRVVVPPLPVPALLLLLLHVDVAVL